LSVTAAHSVVMSADLRNEYVDIHRVIAEAELNIVVERNIRVRIYRIYREREGAARDDHRRDPAWIKSHAHTEALQARIEALKEDAEKISRRYFRAWWRENSDRHTELLGLNEGPASFNEP
jgi:hypothetical protein